MKSKTLFLATALAILPAGAAFAQTAATQTPGADTAAPATGAEATTPDSSATAPSATTSSAPDATAAADAGATSAATQADLKAGAAVYDSAGATVGTIQSVTATGAVVASGKLRAEIPVASFAKSSRGLVIGITKAEFEAAVNRAKS
jgi:hypothetical protein